MPPGALTDPKVEAYLDARPEPQRRTLRQLQALLRHWLPGHPEVMSYAMPGFRQPGPGGKMVAGYAGFARNCGFYPHSGSVIPSVLPDFPDLPTTLRFTKGALSFPADSPPPEALIRALVTARLRELGAETLAPGPSRP